MLRFAETNKTQRCGRKRRGSLLSESPLNAKYVQRHPQTDIHQEDRTTNPTSTSSSPAHLSPSSEQLWLEWFLTVDFDVLLSMSSRCSSFLRALSSRPGSEKTRDSSENLAAGAPARSQPRSDRAESASPPPSPALLPCEVFPPHPYALPPSYPAPNTWQDAASLQRKNRSLSNSDEAAPVPLPSDAALFPYPGEERSRRQSLFSTGSLPLLPEDVNVPVALLEPEKYKTKFCRNMQETGTCRYGDSCLFAHAQSELRTRRVPPYFKTRLCSDYGRLGHCSHGIRCMNIH